MIPRVGPYLITRKYQRTYNKSICLFIVPGVPILLTCTRTKNIFCCYKSIMHCIVYFYTSHKKKQKQHCVINEQSTQNTPNKKQEVVGLICT